MLTARDREIAKWIGRQGVVRAEHVMTRFSIGRTATYRRLHELVDYGLVRRHRLLYNDGGLLTATAEGLRWAELHRLSPARISLALVPHMIASAALAADARAAAGARNTPQRPGASRGRERGRAAAGVRHPRTRSTRSRTACTGPTSRSLAADGERVVAIEIELTLKTKTRLERILRGYLRNRNVASVRYYAPPQIAEAVRRAARRRPAADRAARASRHAAAEATTTDRSEPR